MEGKREFDMALNWEGTISYYTAVRDMLIASGNDVSLYEDFADSGYVCREDLECIGFRINDEGDLVIPGETEEEYTQAVKHFWRGRS